MRRRERKGKKTVSKKNNPSPYADTLYLAAGEVVVAVLVCAVYLLLKKFDYTVALGALLGGAVTVTNLLVLSISVNRAINKYVEERGSEEMDEEEAAEYAKKNGMAVQNAMTRSYLLRTVLMLGALVLALISGWFDTIATVIPLLMYRPLIYLTELLKKKRGE